MNSDSVIRLLSFTALLYLNVCGTLEHLAYESAGHQIGEAYLPAGSTLIAGGRLATGGTPEGNARAQADSWPRVLKFLRVAFRR